MAKPPLKFVQAFVDRHGHARYYFRRAGFKRVALPGLLGSPVFMSAYMDAMAGQAPQPTIIERAALPGTINALAVSYQSSAAYRSMKASTQAVYRNIIDRFREKHGDKRVDKLQRQHIVAMMAARADKPGGANNFRKAMRAMLKHAVDIGMRPDDPTQNVRAMPLKSDGFHSWTEEEIAQFEAFHPIGSKARLAFGLFLCTGQRRSDVVKMGRQHIRDGLIHVKQVKTGAELWIPVCEELQEIIAASSVGQMTFLVTEYGKPFSAPGFTNWFRDQCNKAGLKHCSAHGLRKACARRLADALCTEHEIAAITGHTSLREVVRYTRGADQKRLAISAMQKMKTGTEVSTPDQGLTIRAKIS
jgi:integrase